MEVDENLLGESKSLDDDFDDEEEGEDEDDLSTLEKEEEEIKKEKEKEEGKKKEETSSTRSSRRSRRGEPLDELQVTSPLPLPFLPPPPDLPLISRNWKRTMRLTLRS